MYSEIVDAVILRSGRPDLALDVQSYVNQTIRQLSAKAFFDKNLVEDGVTAAADPHTWTRPVRLQRLQTVRYPSGLYPEFHRPGRVLRNKSYYYYAAATYYIFKGCSTGTVAVAYFQFPKRLEYRAAGIATRLAIYSQEDETWTYDPSLTTDALQLAQRENVSNWLLLDWYDLVMEGTLAKIFKQVKDTERSATHYSQFMRTISEEFLATEHQLSLGK